MNMKSHLFVFTILSSLIFGQSEHTFITYNLLNYQDEDDREDDLISVIEYIEPDLIIAQEVVGQDGYDHFLTDVLEITGPGLWSGADFINQSASIDIALFYRHDIFTFINTSLINTAQSTGTRDVVEFVMEHIGSGVQFNVYGVHLKASSGGSNAQIRLAEATALREYLDDLPSGSHYMVAGDFNIYSNSSTSEPAFDMLTAEGDDEDGRLFDPIDMPGSWHNNSSFAEVHTQSPRGGNYGGMDDRFDWIFVSEAVLNETYEINYVEDTYWAVGNDGNHFNLAINDGNNYSVSEDVADALHDASDHLPVMAKFVFPLEDPSPYSLVITEVMVNPSAVSDSYGEWLEIYNNDSVSIDLNNWQLADGDDDFHQIQENYELNIDPGKYFVLGRNADSLANGGYVADYEYSGFQLANTSDEIYLLDNDGRIVDELDYTSSFPYSSGSSMFLPDMSLDNGVDSNWVISETPYGNGDNGTPGRAWDDTLFIDHDIAFIPDQLLFYPAYPNPFNPTTTIRFSVGTKDLSLLQIFDISGRRVETLVSEQLDPGEHEVVWEASSRPSGVYFVRLYNGRNHITEKLILLK